MNSIQQIQNYKFNDFVSIIHFLQFSHYFFRNTRNELIT